jgi:hypothetical protein
MAGKVDSQTITMIFWISTPSRTWIGFEVFVCVENTKFSTASNNGNHFEYLPSPTKFGLIEFM